MKSLNVLVGTSPEDMDWKEQCCWIRKLWEHRTEALRNPSKWSGYEADYWHCVKCTASILANNHDYSDDYLGMNGIELVWTNFGKYMTDYGEGTSWDTLILLPNGKYRIISDGSL